MQDRLFSESLTDRINVIDYESQTVKSVSFSHNRDKEYTIRGHRQCISRI